MAWRAAERAFASLEEEAAEWHQLHADVAGLRALHHRLFAARLDDQAAGGSAAVSSPSVAALAPRQLI